MPEASPLTLPPLADDHALLCTAVRAAGEQVLTAYHDRSTRAWAKADRSPITEADLAANETLRAHLMGGGRGGYGWLSEESADDRARLRARRVWIVDPIDGTRAFIERRPEFTVCAALVEGSEAVAGAIFNPVTGEFFEAIRGGGARCNGIALNAGTTQSLAQARLLGWPSMFQHPGWPEPWPDGMQVGYRNSTSYRMALVAKGTYDATLALLPKSDWDVAPGALIAHEAGAITSDHLGGTYAFNQPHPKQRALVCAGRGLHSAIIDRVSHLPPDLTSARA